MKQVSQQQLFEQLEMFFDECRQEREDRAEASRPVFPIRKKEIVDPWPSHMRFD